MTPHTKDIVRKLIVVVIFFAATFAIWHWGLKDLFSLKTIQEYGSVLHEYIAKNRIQGMLIFVFINIMTMFLFFPVAVLFDLLAGFLFGQWVGSILVVISTIISACLLFWIAQTSFGKPLRARAGKFYVMASTEMQQGAIGYLLFMRLVPVFPFALVNIIAALLHVPLWTLIWTTALGSAPSTFIYARLGEALGTVDNVYDLLSLDTILGLALLGFLALVPMIAKKRKSRRVRHIPIQPE